MMHASAHVDHDDRMTGAIVELRCERKGQTCSRNEE